MEETIITNEITVRSNSTLKIVCRLDTLPDSLRQFFTVPLWFQIRKLYCWSELVGLLRFHVKLDQ